ncbi:uncharacterized protein PgNI_03250, partial [Pyricularia grisea]|uniref:Uncharacterized protein n=1 Tax=Pyricularia grisea TaxID=148305 RepID=A0A6P8B8V3_PYRGI
QTVTAVKVEARQHGTINYTLRNPAWILSRPRYSLVNVNVKFSPGLNVRPLQRAASFYMFDILPPSKLPLSQILRDLFFSIFKASQRLGDPRQCYA